MRTIMQYNGKPHPVMNCHFKTRIYPPLPDTKAADYREKYQAWDKAPQMLVELEIVFPRYYWRAKYLQEGKSPLWIGDCPMTGNAVQLKDCTFENLVDLRLPNGDTLRGFPEKGMPADMIREHTAILEQERLLVRGGGDTETTAAIAKLQESMSREHGQHAETLERMEQQGAEIVGEANRLRQGKRGAEEKPMDAAREVVEMLVSGLDAPQRNLFFAMKRADGNQTHAARELGVAQSTVNKSLPALRDAVRASGKELPEFLLPPAERRRMPDAPRKMAFGAGGIEAADTRTPFDEVAEREEMDGGAE